MKRHLIPALFACCIPALVAAESQDWSGLHAGLSANHVSGKNHWDGLGGFRLESGNRAAAFVGYNHDFGRYVLGVEAGSQLGKVRERADAAYRYTALHDVRLRLGRDLGRAMIYVAGGYSRARFDDDDKRFGMNGANLGVGVDFRLGTRFVLGIDYTTRRFKDTCPHDRDIKARVNTASLRLSYRF